jgi:uncharacterized membrane protein YdbT with pleckstrin-like domain
MTMPFPKRLLAEDEEVLLDLHPHWKALVWPVLLLPVTIGVTSFIWFSIPEHSWRPAVRWAVAGLAILILLRLTVWPYLVWFTTNYVLTNRRVIIRRGVLSRSGRDIPLTRVNDVSFRHSVLERPLRCGTLTIESAGENGQVVLPDVPRVEWVQREVYRAVEAETPRVDR